MIKLGGKVVSRISGFTGTVTGICNYMYSQTRVEVTAPSVDGAKPQSDWFYGKELKTVKPVKKKEVKKKVVKPKSEKKK